MTFGGCSRLYFGAIILTSGPGIMNKETAGSKTENEDDLEKDL
jgi:hypothetical protein